VPCAAEDWSFWPAPRAHPSGPFPHAAVLQIGTKKGNGLHVPRVSVVIATWNRPGRLRRLLAQLRDQTTTDLEIIAVDDGSEPPISNETQPDSIPPVILLRQHNAGPACARHRGILASRGELVVLLDDDMGVEAGFIASHVREHAAGSRSVVLGQIRPDPGLRCMPIFERFHALMLERFASGLSSGEVTLRGTHLCTGNVSFPRADYLAVGGFDTGLDRSEDAELGIRFEKAGLELRFSREAFSTHHSDHASLRVWMGRAFRYGINDRRIGWKHRDTVTADPWRFLDLMHPLARPLLLLSAFAPWLGFAVARVGMASALVLDRLGLERPALAGTTVVYAMEYFRGVRHALGSIGRTLDDWRFYAVRRPAGGRRA
jgi:glycosyltransferase involved in cell wall biosynthesis